MGKKVIPRFLGALVNFCKTDFLYLCITSMRKEDNGEKMGTGEEFGKNKMKIMTEKVAKAGPGP